MIHDNNELNPEAVGDASIDDAPGQPVTVALSCPLPDRHVLRLRGQSARDKRVQKWLGATTALAVVAFVVLVYVPSSSTLSALHSKISSNASRLAADEQRSARLALVAQAASQLDSQVGLFRPIHQDRGIYDFIGESSSLSNQLHLESFTCHPQEPTVEGRLGIQPVQISFTSDFLAAHTWLRNIESIPRLLRIRELTIRPAPQAAAATVDPTVGKVHVQVIINLYFESVEERA